jgi:hypothetical protein
MSRDSVDLQQCRQRGIMASTAALLAATDRRRSSASVSLQYWARCCVRISAAMSRFLDPHGVLDADYERALRRASGPV